MKRRPLDAAAAPAHLDRRAVLRLGAGAAVGALAAALQVGASRARAQALPTGATVRVGLVLPGRTGLLAIEEAITDLVGDVARVGATLAETDAARAVEAAGLAYRPLPASSPSPEAAVRAAERLLRLEEAGALVGGFGVGQAEVLAEVAEAHGVPFFNVGSTSDALRRCAPGYTFHVEPSQAMLLDALVAWHASRGARRWFLIDDRAHSGGVAARLRRAVERHGDGGAVVGAADVFTGQPLYQEELDAAADAGADVVLLAVDVRDEIYVRYAVAEHGPAWTTAALPTPVTQTRDFLAASRVPQPPGVLDRRVLTWEPTLSTRAADDLNRRGSGRGQPFDAAGWATYQAVTAYVDAVLDAGSVEPDAVRTVLRDPAHVVRSAKGAGVGFRPWDQQLRQPLYVTEVDPDAPWGMNVGPRLAVGRLAGVLPGGVHGDVVEALDAFGDGPTDGGC